VLRHAHLGLAPYRTGPDFRRSIPNKPVEYWSAGLPVLTCLDGLLAETIASDGVGVAYPPGDPEALAGILDRLRRDPAPLVDMGQRARSLFARSFRADLVLARYRKWIADLAHGRPPDLPHLNRVAPVPWFK